MLGARTLPPALGAFLVDLACSFLACVPVRVEESSPTEKDTQRATFTVEAQAHSRPAAGAAVILKAAFSLRRDLTRAAWSGPQMSTYMHAPSCCVRIRALPGVATRVFGVYARSPGTFN